MVKVISRDKLKDMLSTGEKFKLVDVLDAQHFQNEHIKGAISLPLKDIEKKAAELLNKDEEIVVYCASFECTASTQAAEKLTTMGYRNVLDYKGGLEDYKEANLPLEGSLHETATSDITPECCCC